MSPPSSNGSVNNMFDGISISFAPLIALPLLIGFAVAALILVLWRWCGGRAASSCVHSLSPRCLPPSLTRAGCRSVASRSEGCRSDRGRSIASQNIDGRDHGPRRGRRPAATAGPPARNRGARGAGRLNGDRNAESSRDNEGTRLFSGLERALADLPRRRMAGVVVVTDGQVHDVPESAEALGARRHPSMCC